MSSYPTKLSPPPYEPPAVAMNPVVIHSPTSFAPPPVVVQPQVITAAPAPVYIQSAQQPNSAVPDNVAIAKGKLGGKATITTCTNCRQRMETRVIYKSGWFAWSMCILLICIGLFFGPCLIPFFWSKCKDAHHYCTLCNKKLCVHKRCC